MRSIPLLLTTLLSALLAPSLCAQVVINEIMQNPQAVPDNAGEWFEF